MKEGDLFSELLDIENPYDGAGFKENLRSQKYEANEFIHRIQSLIDGEITQIDNKRMQILSLTLSVLAIIIAIFSV
ncbi:hypothetical protein GCM10007063_08860 [Lentibacillus kapialis]|uniref:Uncharacterized protein n=1 Tax=Lentibacillus kapialis TaxID=340214 RepID=A0A917UVN8_9BACI|nr:hypothetical protein [Lentibacillus kapialis]GGJ88567.1 hypothetical protein GCM10007063_08860 [Lentibacillus kapialis]